MQADFYELLKRYRCEDSLNPRRVCSVFPSQTDLQLCRKELMVYEDDATNELDFQVLHF